VAELVEGDGGAVGRRNGVHRISSIDHFDAAYRFSTFHTGQVANRLAQSTSPYLRQHADNPVDWWPWSDEALAEARSRDVPILLSVGYAACHWCHVMR